VLQALQWQAEQMRRATAARTRLMRTIDCLQEAIMLLDTSSTNWHMMYANDAFREASGMPLLLATGQPGGSDGGGGGSAQKPMPVASPLDFWQVFGHVTAGAVGTYSVSHAPLGCLLLLHLLPCRMAASVGGCLQLPVALSAPCHL
jgi:hypothetical protein